MSDTEMLAQVKLDLRRAAKAERDLIEQEQRAERRLDKARRQLVRADAVLSDATVERTRRAERVELLEAAVQTAQAARAAGPGLSTTVNGNDPAADVPRASSGPKRTGTVASGSKRRRSAEKAATKTVAQTAPKRKPAAKKRSAQSARAKDAPAS
jgi:hypothetical protein